ncbi:MAG: L,D-transpeptidase family protein, partial [Candidatus Hydrogenedentes bacterium]|nr:L,D-transpeptidase family protein [Candidatus Hydrogenedentota bacterium]
ALDAIGELNVTLAFSQMETPESKYYTIESGDNLIAIGVKLNTTQGLLIRANGIADPSKLHLGQRLKYTPKDFRILIERSTCRIFLMDSQGPFKRYYTGLGMPGHETTLGTYTVGSKQKDPTWFPANRPSVPPGDPANELGSRWIPMVPAEEGLPSDLGIHGTVAPESIGLYMSHGCPRMLNGEVEELYDLVVRSTPVEVVDTVQWAAYRSRE